MKIRILSSDATSGSIAVSADGQAWLQVNAALRPQPAQRSVVLTDARLDHVAGLLGLRDGPALELYCTPRVFEELTSEWPLLPVLDHYCGVHWHLLPIAGEQRSAEFRLPGVPGLLLKALAVEGEPPPHSPRRVDPAPGDTIALLIEDEARGERLFHAPVLTRLGEAERAWMAQAHCLLVGGLGDAPDNGVGELAGLGAGRKLLTQLPADHPWRGDADASRQQLAVHGIELAHDGMEIVLP
jgi:pyrroloquinoline quinone biosynthesis protein B